MTLGIRVALCQMLIFDGPTPVRAVRVAFTASSGVEEFKEVECSRT